MSNSTNMTEELRLPRGNDFNIDYKVRALNPDGTAVDNFDLRECTDVSILLRRDGTWAKPITDYVKSYSFAADNNVIMQFDGTKMWNGSYYIAITGKIQGKSWRTYSWIRIFTIVEYNEEANIPLGSFIADGEYAVERDFVLSFMIETQADWAQTDDTLPDYIKNKPDVYVLPSTGIPSTDLSSAVQASLEKANTALQSESDPTVPSWAKQPNKPTYTASEVGALPSSTTIPDELKDLQDDATHRLVTDTEKATWNGKQATLVSGTNIKTINNESILGSGNINIEGGGGGSGEENVIEIVKVNGTALTPDANKAVDVTVPTKVSDLTNDSGFISTESDPTVPSWAKASSKPSYTASEVGAVPTTRTVNGKALSEDITLSASDVGALPSSTVIPDAQIQSDWNQTTTTAKDYIKNKPTIPSAQVNSDWNASSGVSQILNKPTIPSQLAQLTDDATHRVVSDTEKDTWNGKAEKVAVINHGTDDTTYAVTPNKLHIWGTVASLTLTLATPTDNTIVNEYMIEFTSGSTATTLSLPASVEWGNRDPLTGQTEPLVVAADATYQISIINNIGLWTAIANS